MPRVRIRDGGVILGRTVSHACRGTNEPPVRRLEPSVCRAPLQRFLVTTARGRNLGECEALEIARKSANPQDCPRDTR